MKELINPKTGEVMKRFYRVLTYGITDEQTIMLLSNIPSADIEVLDVSDCFTDIITTAFIALIVNPYALEPEHIDIFNEITEEFYLNNEKIVFVADHPFLDRLKHINRYTIFSDDFEFESKIKYVLLQALQKEKKMKTYSYTISQTIRVLSEIRKHPYISTNQLAEIIERTPRTVQRYINTLICAGEFIEYDRKKKGWYMYENKSILLDY